MIDARRTFQEMEDDDDKGSLLGYADLKHQRMDENHYSQEDSTHNAANEEDSDQLLSNFDVNYNKKSSLFRKITIQSIPLDMLLTIVKFLPKTKGSSLRDISKITLAGVLNDYDMLEHFMQMKDCDTQEISRLVALSGNLKALKWVVQKGCPMSSPDICKHAASSGNLNMLRWARNQGCKWDETTCSAAVEFGNLEILRWAHSQGCPWDEWTLEAAASTNSLELVQWLHSKGCPWDEWTFYSAVLNGNLDMLKWLHTHGCSWGTFGRIICSAAANIGNLEMLQWLHSLGCPLDERACISAVKRGDDMMLLWLHNQGCLCSRHVSIN